MGTDEAVRDETARGPLAPGPPGLLGRILASPWGFALLSTGGYLLAVELSWVLGPHGSEVVVFWPAAGVAVGAMAIAVKRGPRHAALLALGIFLVVLGDSLLRGNQVTASLVFAVGNLVEALVGGWLFIWLRSHWRRPVGFAPALAVAAVAGAFASTLTVAVVLARDTPAAPVVAGLEWFTSDVAGVLAVAPLLLARPSPKGDRRISQSEVLVLLAAILAITGLAYLVTDSLPMAWLSMPVVLWVALRLNQRWVAFIIVAQSFAISWSVVAGVGAFKQVASQPIGPTLAQAFVAVMAFTALVLNGSSVERRTSQAEVEQEKQLLHRVIEDAVAGILLVSMKPTGRGRVLTANPAARELLDRDPVGVPWESLVVPEDRALVHQALDGLGRGQSGGWRGEIRHLRDGEPVATLATVSMSETERFDTIASIQLVEIQDLKDAQELLRTQALRDSLTGLPNRLFLDEELERALRARNRTGDRVALIFCDVDNFKTINDRHGHPTGDQVLIEIGQRLQSSIRPLDVVARQGGDEFVVLCGGIDSPDTALDLARRILDSVRRPITLAGRELRPAMSIGVALSDWNSTAIDLMRWADSAMYDAKRQGKNRITLFTGELGSEDARRHALAGELAEALLAGHLEPYFQPIIDAPGNAIVAVESLVRWRHPIRGVLAAAEFIWAAEDTALIGDIDEFMIRESLARAAAWPATCTGERPRIHINVAARELGGPRQMANQILQLARSYDLPAHRIVVELTETSLMSTKEDARAELAALREAGVRLAADDFGTGYSTLVQFVAVPIDILKVDRDFVSSMLSNTRSMAVVDAIVKLGISLGLEVVAEGVESEEEIHALRQLGVHQLQGYFFDRPMPDADLRRRLAAGVSARAVG